MPHFRIVSFSAPPNLNGIAMACRQLADRLLNAGHTVSLDVRHQEGALASLPWRDKLTVRDWHTGGNTPRERVKIDEVARLFRHWHDNPSASTIINGWGALPWGLERRTLDAIESPRTMISHGFYGLRPPWHRTFPWGLGEWLRRLPRILMLPALLRRLDAFVVLSQQRDLKNYLDHSIASCVIPQRIHVIPNPIPADVEMMTPQTVVEPEDAARVVSFLCVGYYSHTKNQQRLVRLFMNANIPHARLVCVGHLELDYYRALCSELGDRTNGHIKLLYGISREQTLECMRTADIVVSCSRAETQPIVLIEAMAMGKPFLSTNVGSVKEWSAAGILATTDQEWIASLRRLGSDAVLRQQLGSAGSELAANRHDSKTVTRKWDAVLRMKQTSAE